MNPLMLITLLPLLAGSIGYLIHNKGVIVSQITQISMMISLVAVIYITAWHPISGSISLQLVDTKKFGVNLELQWDHLTAVMLLLIYFMSFIMHAYSSRYLASDSTQGRFMAQLSLLTFSISILVMSGNLFTAFLGWEWIGFCLYLLLNHYHYDWQANKAAKKKFIINRLGDLCFLLAVILAYRCYENSSFSVLFSAKDVMIPWLGEIWSSKTIIISLVFVAIMTKSAQFPFHIWLPDTMETPTPVSALMHAGVINSGGFLMARMSPMIIEHSMIMSIIFIVGFITLIMGSFFFMTQTDIKKQLAYSTMGQMGYMTLQAGLGLFPLAVFHLITHGFYKASLFLNSGSTIQQNTLIENKTKGIEKFLKIIFTLSSTLLIVYLGSLLLKWNGKEHHLNALIFTFIAMSIAQIIWGFNIKLRSTKRIIFSLIMIMLIFLFYFYIMENFFLFLSPVVKEMNSKIALWQLILIGGLMAIQILSWIIDFEKLSQRKFGKHLYLLSFNKLGIEPIYRRYLLKPLRSLGDIGNNIILSKNKFRNIIVVSSVIIFILGSLLYGVNLWINDYHINHQTILIINMILFIAFLITANRARNLKNLFLFLVIIEMTFVNVGLYQVGSFGNTSAIFHLINISLLLLSLLFLVAEHQKQAPIIRSGENELPWLSIYLSFILLLLIGIPGTASFVSEFFILYNLFHTSVILGFIFGMGYILLAIVILHLLQLYVFNPSNFSRENPRLSKVIHGVCIVSILFNLANGLFPATLLHLLSEVRGIL